ncbi:autotransporter outer membrane beta-barrel domain-containing protein [Campylobacter sp. 2018MI13]|uniref:autotransporter outer membrane beta-barrel domain-containing protein n=1 Tax=Campylobacter sp. 2018MI13 TaxID=2836737 RepID=UPI001BDA6444|nr:autotransporter outer membrane beta-barrel domain-containing protein [Campylobacter sp. 2018MI13]MBT0882214.1 hypothetical protein [Campylobacter sp. 2018MI13]
MQSNTINVINKQTHNAAETDKIINQTGGTLNIGNTTTAKNYTDLKVTSTGGTTNITNATISNSELDLDNQVIFDKANNLNKVNLQGNKNSSGFNYLLKDTASVTFDGSVISDVKLEAWSESNTNGSLIIKNSLIHDSQLGLEKINSTSKLTQRPYVPKLILESVIVDKIDDNKTSSIFTMDLNTNNSSIIGTEIRIKNNAEIDSTFIDDSSIILQNTSSISIKNNSNINANINSVSVNNNAINTNVTLDNSEISGSITASNLTATNGSIINSKSIISGTTNISDSTIKADISSKNLNITNSTASGTADKKLDIQSTGNHMQLNGVTFSDVALSSGNNRIDLNGDNTFNRILVKNENIKGTGHHITLGNNASATFNDSEFINTAINNFSSSNTNTTTFNNSKLTNTAVGLASTLDNVVFNGGSIVNTDKNISILANNIEFNSTKVISNLGTIKSNNNKYVFNNSEYQGNINLGNTYFNNTKVNADFIGGKIYFDGLSSVSGTLKGANIYLNDENKKVLSDIIYEKGLVIAEQSLKFDGKEDFKDKEYNFGFFVENDVTLDINNLKMSNNSINAWRKNSADSLVNNKVNISNSSLKEVGIGIHNNSSLIKYMTDYLSFTKTTITNNNANNMIYAKVIDIKDSNITAPMITTLNQEYLNSTSNAIYYKINKIGTFLNIDNSIINSSVETGELHLKNNSVLNGNIQGTQKVYIDNSTLNGNITKDNRNTCFEHEGCSKEVEDVIITNSTIKGDINEVGNVSLTNTNLEASNVIVKNDISIDNSTSTETKTITGNFKVGNDFKSSNTIFSGDITANKLLSDNKSTFQGNVSADSISAVGSIFKQTLTITGDSKNNVLDKATLEQGIIIDSKDAKVSVINGSEIKGEIKNEGFINVEKGSTVSELVSGSGTLSTDGAWYDKNVSMGKIEGENNTFKGDVIITNTNTEVKADNNTFLGNVSVNNGKLSATTNNNFKDINANNIDFINDDIKTTDEIKAQTIKVDDKLVIKNIDLKTTSISANKGEITNSNVFLNNTNEGSKDTKVFLKGKDDNASSVYDKAEITSGDYTIEKSAIKGGIRANTLTTTNSKIVGQLAVNNLNATNSTFYITGGGYNTSLYNHFSGAIIARYGASGFNNIINISNTNLGLLINGYVPIAIINNTNNSNTTNSNSTRADMIATTPKVVNKDFFKITYTTPISSVLLSPNLVHYTTMQDENGTKEVWSVGLAGKELSKDEIQAIIDGKGNVNYTTTELINKNYKDYFMSELLDDNTKAELKSIINTPYYVAKNQTDILNDRFTYLRDDIKNHGFWMNNSYNYLKTNYNDLRNKGTSVGIDKNISLDRFNLTYGVFANISRLEINKALSSSTNVRSFGAYASTNFYNGSFIDYSLAYVTLKNKFEAKKIDLYTTNYLDLYQIGLGLGHRFSINNNYLEPNIKLIATRFKDLDLKGTNASIETKKGLQASIKAGVKAGVEFNKNFSLVTELQYFKDLNALSKSKVVALLENSFNNIQDSGLNAKIGFLVKPNSKLDINADFTKNISNEFDTGYRLNLGFSYKF